MSASQENFDLLETRLARLEKWQAVMSKHQTNLPNLPENERLEKLLRAFLSPDDLPPVEGANDTGEFNRRLTKIERWRAEARTLMTRALEEQTTVDGKHSTLLRIAYSFGNELPDDPSTEETNQPPRTYKARKFNARLTKFERWAAELCRETILKVRGEEQPPENLTKFNPGAPLVARWHATLCKHFQLAVRQTLDNAPRDVMLRKMNELMGDVEMKTTRGATRDLMNETVRIAVKNTLNDRTAGTPVEQAVLMRALLNRDTTVGMLPDAMHSALREALSAVLNE